MSASREQVAPKEGSEVAAVIAKAKPRKAPRVMGGLIALLVVAGGVSYFTGRDSESTDDAQVDGHIINIASRVAGKVDKVLVKDDQLVEQGDILAELDRDELTARLAAAAADQKAAQASLRGAEAQLAIAEAAADKSGPIKSKDRVSGSRANVEQTQADLDSARARFKLAQVELSRAANLRKEGVISPSEFDAKQSAHAEARAAMEQADARLQSARIGNEITAPAQVEAARAAVDLALARVAQTEAATRLAEVNLAYATIKAPIRGIVSRRTVEEGQVVGPGSPLLALVPPDDVWIVANFKEDQIRDMRPGQPAKVRIDSFGSVEFRGVVESIASATGAKFALLPPDNASGNFVKVVQRVPVRIHVEPAPSLTLRPGLSAEVTVNIHAGKPAGK